MVISQKVIIAETLGIESKFLDKFTVKDVLNPGNTLSGFIIQKRGLLNGSMQITHVNGEVSQQFIYGTPKLQYPYVNTTSRVLKKLPSHTKALFFTKWNGANILFYKYKDASGKIFVTAKTKKSAVVKNNDYGKYESLTMEATVLTEWKNIRSDFLSNDEFQSLSLELCGYKEPHLVNYPFGIKLMPLFYMGYDGSISPCELESAFECGDDVHKEILESQKSDFEANNFYRSKNGLKVKYEYNHFITEGKVLYLLDEGGKVVDRVLYKIKPEDVEEVHWRSFARDVSGRVVEAVNKLKMEGLEATEERLKDELDMGKKEWSAYGKEVMEFLKSNRIENPLKVKILVGIPGSGKSTYAAKQEGFKIISQDELGSRKACVRKMKEYIFNGDNIIVDRCNFDESQRYRWIEIAKSFGAVSIEAIVFTTPAPECKRRVKAREGHPTIKKGDDVDKIIDRFGKTLTQPTFAEGFTSISCGEGLDHD